MLGTHFVFIGREFFLWMCAGMLIGYDILALIVGRLRTLVCAVLSTAILTVVYAVVSGLGCGYVRLWQHGVLLLEVGHCLAVCQTGHMRLQEG